MTTEATDQPRQEDFQQLPETLQDFLLGVGVVNPRTRRTSGEIAFYRQTSSALEQTHFEEGLDEDIFESSIDLSEERLRFVFNMFDTDADGRISYDMLREGLEVQTRRSLELDEETFHLFVGQLDRDQSGDVSFEEFAEGIRLLMLRALLHPDLDQPDMSELEVYDYDYHRLERSVVNDEIKSSGDLSNGDETHRSTTTAVQTIKRTDFFFNYRPLWIKTRWINVMPKSQTSCILTLKRLAVSYGLHPLSVEDAMQETSRQRPKVEVYSNHYHIMVPVLSLVSLPLKGKVNSVPQSGFFGQCYNFLCCQRRSYDGGVPHRSLSAPKVDSHIVNIFVNVPQNDTLITFSEHVEKDHCWHRVQRELQKSYSKLRQYDAQYLTYALLDQVVDLIHPITHTMRKELLMEIEHLQKVQFNESLEKVHAIRREMEFVCRKIKPLKCVVSHAIEDEAISPGATVYLRDVMDNLEQEDEALRELIVECQNVDVEADKVHSYQMDRTLYTLTVVSAIFLPAQFLTGVWGMNFESMPELDDAWFYPGFFWGLTAVIMVTLLAALNFGRVGRSFPPSWKQPTRYG